MLSVIVSAIRGSTKVKVIHQIEEELVWEKRHEMVASVDRIHLMMNHGHRILWIMGFAIVLLASDVAAWQYRFIRFKRLKCIKTRRQILELINSNNPQENQEQSRSQTSA